jgi:hypothetical protein
MQHGYSSHGHVLMPPPSLLPHKPAATAFSLGTKAAAVTAGSSLHELVQATSADLLLSSASPQPAVLATAAAATALRHPEQSVQGILSPLVHWAGLVLQSLPSLRWAPLGYQLPSQQPLYAMSNPNDAIERLLGHYQEHVYPHLRVLLGADGNCSSNGEASHGQGKDRANSLSLLEDGCSMAVLLPSPDRDGNDDGSGMAAFYGDTSMASNAHGSSSETDVCYLLAIPYHTLFRDRSNSNSERTEAVDMISTTFMDDLYFPAYDKYCNLVSADVQYVPRCCACLL